MHVLIRHSGVNGSGAHAEINWTLGHELMESKCINWAPMQHVTGSSCMDQCVIQHELTGHSCINQLVLYVKLIMHSCVY